MNTHIDRLSFWTGRDSEDPFYVLCRFRNLFDNESVDIVIDWNNRAARAEFAAVTDELIHDKIAWAVTTVNVAWDTLL